jgi:hypothetical protein
MRYTSDQAAHYHIMDGYVSFFFFFSGLTMFMAAQQVNVISNL